MSWCGRKQEGTLPIIFREGSSWSPSGFLAQSDLNISEIAYQLGFDDASYFTRLFRQIAGTSPSEFRELHR